MATDLLKFVPLQVRIALLVCDNHRVGNGNSALRTCLSTFTYRLKLL